MLWIKTAIWSHTSATVAGWHTVRNPVRADAPAFDARLARLTVSASHSLLRSSALHSMAVTGPFRHAKRDSTRQIAVSETHEHNTSGGNVSRHNDDQPKRGRPSVRRAWPLRAENRGQ